MSGHRRARAAFAVAALLTLSACSSDSATSDPTAAATSNPSTGSASPDFSPGSSPSSDTPPTVTVPTDAPAAAGNFDSAAGQPAAPPSAAPAPAGQTKTSAAPRTPPPGAVPQPGGAPTQPERILPADGTYQYDARGTVVYTSPAGVERRRDLPARIHDQVSSIGSTTTLLTVIDQANSQQLTLDSSGGKLQLVRQEVREDNSGTPQRQVLTPQPHVLLGTSPLTPGSSWEIAWRDPNTSVDGRGRGRVVGREQVRTPAGSFDALVLQIDQTLTGTARGTASLTLWLDPASGRQVKRTTRSDITIPTGRTELDATFTLTG